MQAAAGQEKNLYIFQKSQIAEIKKMLKGLHQDKKQAKDSKVELYESYADGSMAPGEYYKKTDRLDQQTVLLSQQIYDGKNNLALIHHDFFHQLGINSPQSPRSNASSSDFHSNKVKKVRDINLTQSGYGVLCVGNSLPG